MPPKMRCTDYNYLPIVFLSFFFFQDNAIYNLLPDIISRLSDPERGMKEEDFNTIMK